MSSIIELATGSTTTDKFSDGVNKALAVEASSIFEVKEEVANLRKLAARYEATEKASVELEKFNKMTVSNGGDIEDGDDATWTVIDNQALITFGNSTHPISVGFKLTPRLLRQARDDPATFMERYRRKLAFDVAKKEDIYIGSYLCYNASNFEYGGNASAVDELGSGSIFTVEMFETMLDTIKENEYEPTDFIGTAKVIGQLRRDARLMNDDDFHIKVKEDGRTVTHVGDVMVHEIKGTQILPDYALTAAGASGSGTWGLLMDREGAFGLVDFLTSAGASPVRVSVGKPDPTLAGANFHRILAQSELEVQYLDENSIVVARVSKE